MERPSILYILVVTVSFLVGQTSAASATCRMTSTFSQTLDSYSFRALKASTGSPVEYNLISKVNKNDVTDDCYYETSARWNDDGTLNQMRYYFQDKVKNLVADIIVYGNKTTKVNGTFIVYPSPDGVYNGLMASMNIQIIYNPATAASYQLWIVAKWYRCNINTKYDGSKETHVRLEKWPNETSPVRPLYGLCGNCDGVIGNDFIGPSTYNFSYITDTVTRNEAVIDSYRTTNTPGPYTSAVLSSASTYCDDLNSATGPMVACANAASPAGVVRDLRSLCIATVSVNINSPDLNKKVCEVYLKMVSTCSDVNVTPKQCDICPANEVYSLSVPGCQDNCSSPSASSSQLLVCQTSAPGCKCRSGYIRNNQGICVQFSDCGCLDVLSRLHQTGTQWLKPGTSCTKLSTCTAQTNAVPIVQDVNFSCTAHSTCSSDVCVCNNGYNSTGATSSGNPASCQQAFQCPSYLVFSDNAPSCDNTCDNSNAASGCTAAPGARCVCPTVGTVLNGSQCIPPDNCTCTSGATIRNVGAVWPNSNCLSGQTCSRQGGVLSIRPSSSPCSANARCTAGVCNCDQGYIKDSRGFCAFSYAVCQMAANKFRPFDVAVEDDPRLALKPLSSNQYTIVKKSNASDTCYYEVLVTYNTSGSIVAIRYVLNNQVAGQKFTVDVDAMKNVLINNSPVPYDSNKHYMLPGTTINFDVVSTGRLDIKWFSCFFKAYFEGGASFWVRLEAPRQSGVIGLCGNCDGIMNDYITPGGTDISSWTNRDDILIDAYRISPGAVSSPCISNSSVATFCDVFTNTQGPMGACIAAVSPGLVSDLKRACAVSVCLYYVSDQVKMKARVCEFHRRLVTACPSVTVTYVPQACVDACGTHATFQLSTPSCRNTCSSPTAESGCATTVAGCACDVGYILSGAQCVTYDQCGCTDSEGRTEVPPTTWLITSCLSSYTCRSRAADHLPPEMLNYNFHCPLHSKCQGSACVCDFGYHKNNNSCDSDVSCSDVNSLYNPQASTCENTCTDPQAVAKCSDKTTTRQACVCKSGYYILNGTCVSGNSCPCYDNNQTYPVGAIWPYKDCRGSGKTCIVSGPLTAISESAQECPLHSFGCLNGDTNNGGCSCLSGYSVNPVTYTCDFVYCICMTTKTQFVDFEKSSTRDAVRPEVHDPLQSCTYVLSKKVDPLDTCNYEVYASFNADTTISEAVWVINDLTNVWTIKINYLQKMTVNNATVPLNGTTYRIVTKRGSLDVYALSGSATLKWYDCNLRCSYDFSSSLQVRIDTQRPNPRSLGGLCGNCDGEFNDYLDKYGNDLSTWNDDVKDSAWLIGNSRTNMLCNCSTQAVSTAQSRCNFRSSTGPFSACLSSLTSAQIDVEVYGCQASVCALYNTSNTVAMDTESCNFYLRLVSKCAANGFVIKSRPDYCVSICATNYDYTLSLSTCMDTCANLTASQNCPLSNRPGCQCKSGFVRNGDSCVAPGTCGCILGQFGYPVGPKSFWDKSCGNLYTCNSTSNGQVSLSAPKRSQCPLQGAVCVLNDIYYTCECPPGYWTMGNPPVCTAPVQCGGNSTYSLTATQCPDTCTDPTASSPDNCLDFTTFEPLPPAPGCQCNDGYYMKDGFNCVLKDDCGCIDEWGNSRAIGDVWKNRYCFKQFTCLRQPTLPPINEELRGVHCADNSHCEFKDSVAACFCDQHYNLTGGVPGSFTMVCSPAVTCGAHSTYDLMSSTCPNDCTNRLRSEGCPAAMKVTVTQTDPRTDTDTDIPTTTGIGTVVGCTCDDGYILTSPWTWNSSFTIYKQPAYPACVPIINCGCRDQMATIVSVGTSWMYTDCNSMYTCTGYRGRTRVIFTDRSDCSGGICQPAASWLGAGCTQKQTCKSTSSFPVITSASFACSANSHCSASAPWTCLCDSGYVRNTNGTCVASITCGAFSTFSGSASTCPNTCTNPTASTSCTTTAPGCVCNTGYTLYNGACIPTADCLCSGGHRIGSVWPASTLCTSGSQCVRTNGQTQIVSVPKPCTDFATCSGGNCTCNDGYLDNGVICQFKWCRCDVRKRDAAPSSTYINSYDMMYSDRKLTSAPKCKQSLSKVSNSSSECYWDIWTSILPTGHINSININLNNQKQTITAIMRHNKATNTQSVCVNGVTLTSSVYDYTWYSLKFAKDGSGNWEMEWDDCNLDVRFITQTTGETWAQVKLGDGQMVETVSRPPPMDGLCGNCDGVNDAAESAAITGAMAGSCCYDTDANFRQVADIWYNSGCTKQFTCTGDNTITNNAASCTSCASKNCQPLCVP